MKILLVLLMIPSILFAKTIKVAIIDTGFDFNSNWNDFKAMKDDDEIVLKKPVMCKEGHTDFTGKGIDDRIGHGTHVSGIVAKFAEDSDYCLVILKYIDKKTDGTETLAQSNQALQKAIELNVDIINYSGGGMYKNEKECFLIKKALNSGIKVVAAAGNDGLDINKSPYYPAMCDNRVIIVQNIDSYGNLARTSNRSNNKKDSRKLYSEKGTEILSLLPNNKIGYMTGTSQASPTKVGKMIKKMNKR